LNSCSFANKSTVTIPMNSNPPGAEIVIDGKKYGKTPAFIALKPSKNYQATFSKPGYESTKIDMKTWYSIRDGNGGDGKRCIGDSVFVLPIMIVLLFAPEKCGSFKQSDYFVELKAKEIPEQTRNPDRSSSPNSQYQNRYGNQSNQYQNSYYQQYQKQPDSYQNPNQEFYNQYKDQIPSQNQNPYGRN
jgi:hypothetical protein